MPAAFRGVSLKYLVPKGIFWATYVKFAIFVPTDTNGPTNFESVVYLLLIKKEKGTTLVLNLKGYKVKEEEGKRGGGGEGGDFDTQYHRMLEIHHHRPLQAN